jgi:hypothetical protein
MQARTLLAVILASLAGSIVYMTLIYLEPSTAPAAAGRGLVMVALPAMLTSMMFVTFVLLPLWHGLQRREAGRTLLFMLTGSAAWLVVTAALLALTTWDQSEGLRTASQLIVPGLVVVLVFGLVAGRR